MKKGLLLVMAIAAVAAISQWPTSTQEALIEKTSPLDAPGVLSSSSKLILTKPADNTELSESDVTADSREDSDVVQSEARSIAYQQATETFKSLDSSKKTQRRK